MVPAHQGFQADDFPRGHIALGLGVKCELIPLQGPLHLGQEHVVLFHLPLHPRIVAAGPVGIVSLHLPQRDHGPVVHCADRYAPVHNGINAEGRLETGVAAPHLGIANHLVLKAFQHLRAVRQNDPKIISAHISGYPAAGLLFLPETGSDLHQKAVPGLLPVPLVKQLEMFDVGSHETVGLRPRLF